MRTSVLLSVLSAALVVGIAACKGPDSLDSVLNHFQATARGANIAGATDTLANATATMTTAADTATGTIAYTYTIVTPPTAGGTVDSVVLYTAGAAAAITSATANGRVLCAAAGCTGSGTSAKITPGATYTALVSSMRGYGVQLVVYYTGARPSNGSMRGTVFPINQ